MCDSFPVFVMTTPFIRNLRTRDVESRTLTITDKTPNTPSIRPLTCNPQWQLTAHTSGHTNLAGYRDVSTDVSKASNMATSSLDSQTLSTAGQQTQRAKWQTPKQPTAHLNPMTDDTCVSRMWQLTVSVKPTRHPWPMMTGGAPASPVKWGLVTHHVSQLAGRNTQKLLLHNYRLPTEKCHRWWTKYTKVPTVLVITW